MQIIYILTLTLLDPGLMMKLKYPMSPLRLECLRELMTEDGGGGMRPPPPPPPSLTAPYNVLQAMLGHVPAFQPAAFPGLLPVSGVTPTTLVTVTPAPPPEDAANSGKKFSTEN